MNIRRLKKIKTLKDIKLEKARLRYEILIAENNLLENIVAFQRLATISSVFSRVGAGFGVAKNVYTGVSNIINKVMFWRKGKTSHEPPDHEDLRYH